MEIMRTHTASRWLLTAVALMFSAGAAAQLRINEIHYDNVGVDTGEAIEIEGPAGTDITAYSLVLYNGSNGAVYNEEILIGTLPASCGSSGVFVVNYPTDGIQNGSPDAIALVDMFGTVLDYVSYEGVVTATAGPAVGQVPTTSSRRRTAAPRLGLRCNGMPPAFGRQRHRALAPAIRRFKPRWSRASRSHRRILRSPSAQPSH
jgi:hypothetical protein